jgi:hypothetical protein
MSADNWAVCPSCNVWECRLDPAAAWYYGWDCASGCVWNLEVIADVVVDVAAMPLELNSGRR